MTRPLTARMAEALKGGRPQIILCEIDHPSGTFRCWSGIGNLAWDGETWTGIGTLGAITPVQQTSDVSIQEINFVLSGVDAATLGMLSEIVRNRSGRAWIACLDGRQQVIPDPYLFVDSQLDYQTLNADEQSNAQIQITARMGFYTLQRGIDEAWTPQNHKLTYPNDIGLDMIPGLQNQDLLWTAS